MKKCILFFISVLGLYGTMNSQCLTTTQPVDDCSLDDNIDSFTLNSISTIGNAGCANGNGYSTYATPVWTLIPGSTYAWTAGIGNGTEDDAFAIWIDLNNNGIYTAAEMLYSTPATGWGPVQGGNITIPATATTGVPLRMRLRSAYEHSFTGAQGCTSASTANWFWGETEDYFVFIGCSPSVSLTATSFDVCPSGSSNSATLTATGVTSYTWSAGASNSTSIVVTPTTSTIYTLSGTNSTGCISTKIFTINVNANPTITVVNTASNAICNGVTATLTASGANSYTWTGGVTNAVTFTPSATSGYTVTGTNACGTATAAATITVNPLVVSASTNSALVCASRPVTLTATGATSYTWLPGAGSFSNYIVTPGVTTTYSVTGKTGPCFGTNTVLVTTKPNPTLSISPDHSVVCSGNPVNLVVNGNAISYTWSPGGSNNTTVSFNPTGPAVYVVTAVNSVSCTSTAQQIIGVNQNPTITATVSDPTVCAGGSSTLSASGASTYVWSNSANTSVTVVNPTSDASYAVTGTSSVGCLGSTAVAVSVFVPVIGVSSATAICAGKSTIISSDAADSYSWSNNQTAQAITVSPALTTVYSLTAMVSNGNGIVCAATNTVEVDVNSNPTITATSDHSVICINNKAVLTAAGAGANGTYTWTGGSGAVISSTNAVSPISNQAYAVLGVDANGCKGTASISIAVSPCTGISIHMANAANLSIYPNPSNDEFTVSADQSIDLKLVNELGQQVKTISLTDTTRSVKISNLAPGVYFVMGKNANGSVKEKIIITK